MSLWVNAILQALQQERCTETALKWSSFAGKRGGLEAWWLPGFGGPLRTVAHKHSGP